MIRRAWRIAAVSLILGLPAAVLAHAAIFGHAHELGGTDHAVLWAAVLLGAALAVIVGLSAAFGRTRELSPTTAGLLLSTAGWFAVIELREQAHAVPLLQAVALLWLATFAVNTLWRGFTRAAAHIAGELFYAFRAANEPAVSQLCSATVPVTAPHAPAYRLFSRPPPA